MELIDDEICIDQMDAFDICWNYFGVVYITSGTFLTKISSFTTICTRSYYLCIIRYLNIDDFTIYILCHKSLIRKNIRIEELWTFPHYTFFSVIQKLGTSLRILNNLFLSP